jgi:S-formylglutathione hydrolase FrmB
MLKSHPHTLAIQGIKPSCLSLFWALLAAGMALSNSPLGFAQATTKPKEPVIKKETLTTGDGWLIPITYYQSTLGKDASVIILLHGEGDNQLTWTQKTNLATQLHAENFAVVTCDLRKHGGAEKAREEEASKKMEPADYKTISLANKASELETIQEFLFDEHQAGRLNMAKLGILAVDNMVPAALNWAANDWTKKPYDDAPSLAARTPRGQTVRAIAMLSPAENVGGLTSAPPLKFFRMLNGTPVSMLFVNSEEDGSARDMRNMIKQVKTEKNKSVIFSSSYPGMFKGADMFGRVPTADKLVIGFFKKQLQDIDVDWKDRRSRIDQ